MTQEAAIALFASAVVSLVAYLLKRSIDGVDRRLATLEGVVETLATASDLSSLEAVVGALAEKNHEQDTGAATAAANIGELQRSLGRVEKDNENLRERLNGVANHWRRKFEGEDHGK